MRRILVDMHRLKENPYNGLYSFSLNLGRSLAAQTTPDDELHYYLPKNKFGCFGNRVLYEAQHSMNKYYKWGTQKYDVWHAATTISYYKPFNNKTKFVFTIHDLNFLLEGKENRSRNERLLRRIQKRVDRADYIVGISQYALAAAGKYLQLGDKPRKVIYNGCTRNAFPDFDSPVYRPKRPFLFAIGLVQPRKNFHLLPALLKGNDYELVIAGLDHFDYKHTILEEVKRWNMEDRVKLTGAVSEEDKYWYYSHCAAFLFPSFAEGFGLPVIEAMYYGKPVFLSRETCMPEIGGEAAYYFENFQVEVMQENFKQGMQHYRENNPAPAIRQRAAFFSWDTAAAEYLDIYRTI